MLLTMGVTLYTSRVILNTLGVTDFGLHSIIAGMITLFAFLNNTLAASTSRFLTFELGKKNEERLKSVFRTSFNIHFCLAIVVVLLCQTVGLWLVNNILVIPADRLFASNVVYQFVVVSAFLSITQVPLNAMIIAHERMKIFAYLGVSDAVLRLLVAYLITISSFDRLITLGALNLLIVIGIYMFYHIYCKRNFSVYNFGVKNDKKLIKKMIGFSSWVLLASLANMLKKQGVNIMINVFFGAVVNAANALAYQVHSAVIRFIESFMIAIRPQIIKSYAEGELNRMKSLIFKGAKFSFFLSMTFSIPILLETEMILKLWLVNVPEYTITFVRLIVIAALIESFNYTVGTGLHAVGNMKLYSIIISATIISVPLITYFLFKNGSAPYMAFAVLITVGVVNTFIRITFLQFFCKISKWEFIYKVLFVSLIIFLLSVIVPLLLFFRMDAGIVRFIIVSLMSLTSSAFFIYFLGISKSEKAYVKHMIIKALKGDD